MHMCFVPCIGECMFGLCAVHLRMHTCLYLGGALANAYFFVRHFANTYLCLCGIGERICLFVGA